MRPRIPLSLAIPVLLAPSPIERTLTAHPHPPAEHAPSPGLHALGLAKGRDALLYIPRSYDPQHPAPLAVMLHGAGGNAEGALLPFRDLADEAGVILLAPESRGKTWDIIEGGLGPDVAFLDRALAHVFDRLAVDRDRVIIEGFSDGASYALTIGLSNGDLFRRIVAFSPGFSAPPRYAGTPRVFVTHGERDPVLPIDRCSRRLVPALKKRGYDVRYIEFPDGHRVPGELAREALDWSLAPE